MSDVVLILFLILAMALVLAVKVSARILGGGVLMALGASFAYAYRNSDEDVGVFGVILAVVGLMVMISVVDTVREERQARTKSEAGEHAA